jgi:hypothetical protein
MLVGGQLQFSHGIPIRCLSVVGLGAPTIDAVLSLRKRFEFVDG